MNHASIRGSRTPGPERIAGALSVIVVLIAGVAFVASSVGAGGETPRPSASTVPPSTPQPTRAVDGNAVEIARAVNRRLAEAELQLVTELAATRLSVPNVQAILRAMNAQLPLGIDAAARLQARHLSRPVGDRLSALYADLAATIGATLAASVQSQGAYQTGARAVVDRLAELADLESALEGLLDASAPPSTPGVSPTHSPDPSPTQTPESSSPPPTSTIVPGANLVTNGGFEGSIAPWSVELGAGAVAIAELDPDNPGLGSTSLRVTITAASGSRQGISVHHDGLDLAPRTLYRLSLRARAETSRTIRVGVISTTGAAYGSSIGTIGATWTKIELEFLAIGGDAAAIIAIDLGGNDATTWLDDVVLTPVSP